MKNWIIIALVLIKYPCFAGTFETGKDFTVEHLRASQPRSDGMIMVDKTALTPRITYTPLLYETISIMKALKVLPMGYPKTAPWAESYVHYPPLFCLQPKPHMPAGTQHHFWLGTFHAASLKYIFEPAVVDRLASVNAVIFETPFHEYDGMAVLEGGTPPAESSARDYYSAKEPIDLTNASNRALLERITKGLIKLAEKDGLPTEGLTVEIFAQVDLEAVFDNISYRLFTLIMTGALENHGFLSQAHTHAMEAHLARHIYQSNKELYGLESESERLILMDSDTDDESEDEEDKFTLDYMADTLENIEREKAEIVQHAKENIKTIQAAWTDYHCQGFIKGIDEVVDRRNALWLQRIRKYIGTKPKPWLGVVGYGHIPGMLKDLWADYEVYRFNAAAQTWHPVSAVTDWAVR